MTRTRIKRVRRERAEAGKFCCCDVITQSKLGIAVTCEWARKVSSSAPLKRLTRVSLFFMLELYKKDKLWIC